MEAVNGVSDGDKGGPPPPSPLTGCYLLIVIGEPHCNEHKDIILQRVAKGLLSWDLNDCLVDLEKELAIITEQALEGEEARYGERLIQFASENLVTEILIHPVVSTLAQCVRNLLSSFTRHRHIIHAGYTFANNGSWVLQDGTFSLADFSEAFQEIEVLRVIRAYENGISLDIHCAPEGEWTRLPKEPFTKSCKVHVNPNDVLTAGSPSISSFITYLEPFLIPAELANILESSDVVGNIRFSRPTLYVFPGGQGDAALFGINGFNMLLDGGFSRKACFWDFVRHLDRLDAVLLTRLNNSNVNGISAVLRRKRQNAVYPQIGHFFCNIQERKAILSPDGDKDKDPLLVNLLDEGQEIVSNLRHLSLIPQVCYRDSEPINLYHKVGHGTLDMYVLSPAKDLKEVREFLQKWNNNDQKLFANQKTNKDFVFPLQNLVSICALLVWQPANPEDTITRILFPGSSPQNKIFEGLDRIKSLDCIKHPVCSEKSLAPATIKTKQSVLDKIIQPERKIPADNKKEKPPKLPTDNIIETDMKNGEVNGVQPEKVAPVKKSDSTESEKSISKPRKIIENGDKTEKLKPKPKPEPRPKPRSESQQRKVKHADKKPSPTTPKKQADKVNGEAKPKLKASPTATPAKSAKEATNRKVVESKIKAAPKKEPPKPIVEKKDVKTERKPISRRPKDISKLSGSPAKKVNGVQKPDSISRRGKLDKEGTTDSSTVSTPSADQDSILKKDISKLTSDELQNLKAQELADLKEEQEAVKEIEAVFRKGELHEDKPSDFRKIKDLSIDDKLENEEYLIIEKTEIEQEIKESNKEEETQKIARDSEESEKQRKMSEEKETEIEEKRMEIQDEVQKIITSATDIVKAKDEVVELSKEISATSPEEKNDISTDKKEIENEIKEIAPESQPDEKGSANIESGATTTAPTLPEDERMPLDEIKEDNGDQIIEEKHVKEDTKEKDVPVIQLPPKTFENITKLPPVVGIRLDKQSHIRDIVKTPDEVADLPVHEEVDIDHYDEYPNSTDVKSEREERKKEEKEKADVKEKLVEDREEKKTEITAESVTGKEQIDVEDKEEKKTTGIAESVTVKEKSDVEKVEKKKKDVTVSAISKEKDIADDNKTKDEEKTGPAVEVEKIVDKEKTDVDIKEEKIKVETKEKDVATVVKAETVEAVEQAEKEIGNEIEPVISEDLNKKELSKSPDEEKDTDEHELEQKKEKIQDVEVLTETEVVTHEEPAVTIKEKADIAAHELELEQKTDKIKDIQPPEQKAIIEKEEKVDGAETSLIATEVYEEETKKDITESKSDIKTDLVQKDSREFDKPLQLEKDIKAAEVKQDKDDKSDEINKQQESLTTEMKEPDQDKSEEVVEKSETEVKEKDDFKLKDAKTKESIEIEFKHELPEVPKKEIIIEEDKPKEEVAKPVEEAKSGKEHEITIEKVCEKPKEVIAEPVEEEVKSIKEDEEKKIIKELKEEVTETDDKQVSGESIQSKKEVKLVEDDVSSITKIDEKLYQLENEVVKSTEIDVNKKSEDSIQYEKEQVKLVKEDVNIIKEIDEKLQKLKHEVTEITETNLAKTGDELIKSEYEPVTVVKEEKIHQKRPHELTKVIEVDYDKKREESIQTGKTIFTKDDNATEDNGKHLPKLQEEEEHVKAVSEVVTHKIEELQHAEPVIITTDSLPESPVTTERKLEDKLELGRKSPKEREEDVAKIVASVAEVLKSEAPLEEFEGKIPFSIPYKSYTTELRETHITTVESPTTDETKTIKSFDQQTCPKLSSTSLIEEERKIAPIHEEHEEVQESKISKMIKDSNELMQATSRIIQDIKLALPKSDTITEELAAEDEDTDAGIVHRMLVTASSEDGGEEIEICPVGTITFSRSSESSGRSSPDLQSQKLSQKSSIADTASDATVISKSAVKDSESSLDGAKTVIETSEKHDVKEEVLDLIDSKSVIYTSICDIEKVEKNIDSVSKETLGKIVVREDLGDGKDMSKKISETTIESEIEKKQISTESKQEIKEVDDTHDSTKTDKVDSKIAETFDGKIGEHPVETQEPKVDKVLAKELADAKEEKTALTEKEVETVFATDPKEIVAMKAELVDESSKSKTFEVGKQTTTSKDDAKSNSIVADEANFLEIAEKATKQTGEDLIAQKVAEDITKKDTPNISEMTADIKHEEKQVSKEDIAEPIQKDIAGTIQSAKDANDVHQKDESKKDVAIDVNAKTKVEDVKSVEQEIKAATEDLQMTSTEKFKVTKDVSEQRTIVNGIVDDIDSSPISEIPKLVDDAHKEIQDIKDVTTTKTVELKEDATTKEDEESVDSKIYVLDDFLTEEQRKLLQAIRDADDTSAEDVNRVTGKVEEEIKKTADVETTEIKEKVAVLKETLVDAIKDVKETKIEEPRKEIEGVKAPEIENVTEKTDNLKKELDSAADVSKQVINDTKQETMLEEFKTKEDDVKKSTVEETKGAVEVVVGKEQVMDGIQTGTDFKETVESTISEDSFVKKDVTQSESAKTNEKDKSVIENQYDVHNGLETVEKMVVNVLTADRVEEHLQSDLGKEHDDKKDLSDTVDSVTSNIESISSKEEVLEKTAHDIEENYEIVSDMTKSVIFEKCDKTVAEDHEKQEQILEKSAKNLEDNYDTVTEMAQSIVFDKCEKSLTDQQKEGEILEKSAKNLEENYKALSDMTESVVFEKCEISLKEEHKDEKVIKSDKEAESTESYTTANQDPEDIKLSATDFKADVQTHEKTFAHSVEHKVERVLKKDVEESIEKHSITGLLQDVEKVGQDSKKILDVSVEKTATIDVHEDCTSKFSGKSFPALSADIKDVSKEGSGTSTPDLKDSDHIKIDNQDSLLSGKSSPGLSDKSSPALSGRSSPGAKAESKDSLLSGKSSPDHTKPDSKDSSLSGKLSPAPPSDLKVDEKDKLEAMIETTDLVAKSSANEKSLAHFATETEKSGKLAPDFKVETNTIEKAEKESKIEAIETTTGHVAAQEKVISETQAEKSVDQKNEKETEKLSSDKSLLADVDKCLLQEDTVKAAVTFDKKHEDVKDDKKVPLVVKDSGDKTHESDKKTEEIPSEKSSLTDVKPTVEKKSILEDLYQEIKEISTNDLHIPCETTSAIPEKKTETGKDGCESEALRKKALDVQEITRKKLSISDVEISVKAPEDESHDIVTEKVPSNFSKTESSEDAKQSDEKTEPKDVDSIDSGIGTEVDSKVKKTEETEKPMPSLEQEDIKTKDSPPKIVESKDGSIAGPSTISQDKSLSPAKSSTEDLHLSGKSTPDIAEVEKIKEMQETLKHEKHIPGSSTPPTVPVSPIVKEISMTQSEDVKTSSSTPIKSSIASIKDSEIRSCTPGSDDYEIGASTYSDISSGQVSRAPHLLESERIESDDDDDVPGSPMSVTSQVAHSRSSSRYDFEDDRIGTKMDPMNTSFYGALPDEGETELDFEKAMVEHRQTRGGDLVTSTEDSSSYLYEITKAKYSSGTPEPENLTGETQLDQINKNGTSNIMTASFMGDLPSSTTSASAEAKKDLFESWGKPLGLPSPAPPNDNRGTPKKERKLSSNVSAKNKLNDDKKRSESPSKYKNKKLNPVYVDLTYVPHHGNAFYSYVDFFKRVRARYYVFSGIEPSREVYNALLEAKQTWEDKELEVTIIPTYDTDILGYWVAENEELLTKSKIDLSPSASRCTINLQDHETSCSAYRLEF